MLIVNEGTVLLFCKSKTISATFYRHVASLVKGEGQKKSLDTKPSVIKESLLTREAVVHMYYGQISLQNPVEKNIRKRFPLNKS